MTAIRITILTSFFVASVLIGSKALAAETYKVDPVHSSVVFRVKHLNVGIIYGRFNYLQGTIVVDEKNPERSSVELTIRTESIDTGNKDRDDHLRSPDFFNAKQFPVITFKSTQVRQLKANLYEVKGNLSLRGVTRPITIRVERIGVGKGMKGEWRIGFHTTFQIKRSNFNMTYMLNGISDEVMLMVGIEAVRQ